MEAGRLDASGDARADGGQSLADGSTSDAPRMDGGADAALGDAGMDAGSRDASLDGSLAAPTVASGMCTFSALTVSSAVPAGDRLLVAYFQESTDLTPVTVTDSRGNYYQVVSDTTSVVGSGNRTVLLSAFVATALQAGDTITVSHSSTVPAVVRVHDLGPLSSGGTIDAAGQPGSGSGSFDVSLMQLAAPALLVCAANGNTAWTIYGATGIDGDTATCGPTTIEYVIAVRVTDGTGPQDCSGMTGALANSWLVTLVRFPT